MYKLNEKQIEVLKAKGLYEGFFDKLKKAVKGEDNLIIEPISSFELAQFYNLEGQ